MSTSNTQVQSGKLLSRYVKKQALFAMLFAVLGLWLLQVVFSYLSELENISESYTYLDALQYIVYRSPYFLEQFMPTGALLGAVVGLGLLANNSELVVMRSVGVSVYRIVSWVLQPAMIFVVLGLLVNQFVLPKSNMLANQIRNPDVSLLASLGGYWTVQKNEQTPQNRDIIFIDYADADGQLGMVKQWRIDANNNLVAVSVAQQGQYLSTDNQAVQPTNESPKSLQSAESLKALNKPQNGQKNEAHDKTFDWQLQDVTTLHINEPSFHSELSTNVNVNVNKATTTDAVSEAPSKKTTEPSIKQTNLAYAQRLALYDAPLVTQTQESTVRATLPISPESVHLLTQRAEDLSLTQLYEYGQFSQAKQTRSLAHELAFWQKLLSPFAILSLVVVACSFVFGSLRTHSLGLRIVVALLFGLLFSYLQDLVGFVSLATGISPVLMVLLPIILSTMLGLYLLKRQG